MKDKKINITLGIILFLVYSSTYILYLFAKTQIALPFFLGTLLVLVFTFIVFFKKTFLYFVISSVFCFFAQFLGTMLDFYHKIWFYDLVVHFISGVLLVLLGNYFLLLLTKKHTDTNIPLGVAIAFCLFFSIACAGIWEIYEFTVDTFFGFHSQGVGVTDTMTDIIAGTAGALVFSLILLLTCKNGKNRIFPLKN